MLPQFSHHIYIVHENTPRHQIDENISIPYRTSPAANWQANHQNIVGKYCFQDILEPRKLYNNHLLQIIRFLHILNEQLIGHLNNVNDSRTFAENHLLIHYHHTLISVAIKKESAIVIVTRKILVWKIIEQLNLENNDLTKE